MCIICVSPKGIPQPTQTQIQAMFKNNPHGAGYMVARNNQVEIHKGFMNVDEFLYQIQREHFTAADPVVYHFRISTQAGVTPEMTHPFPLTNNIDMCKKLDLVCACGVAHNGVIPMTSTRDKEFSDTALFIAHYMSAIVRQRSDLHNTAILDILEELTRSRLAILDRSGDIATVGSFITETNGLQFSNFTYGGVKTRCRPTFSKSFLR